jgi:hypothetical protein
LWRRGSGYKTLEENLEAFDRISCLPGTLKLLRDEGKGMEATFCLHKAKWHDDYRQNKTPRGKCLMNMIQSPTPRKFTRLSREHEHHSTEMCFFCGKSAAGDDCVMHQLLKLIFM